MRRLMTGPKSSRTEQLTGMGQRYLPWTLMSINMSIGGGVKHRLTSATTQKPMLAANWGWVKPRHIR
jgi:hypothetical protein